MSLIFYAEYTESVLDILSDPESSMGAPWLGPEKNFQNGGSHMAGKQYFKDTVYTFFNYTFFQLTYKQYVALTL